MYVYDLNVYSLQFHLFGMTYKSMVTFLPRRLTFMRLVLRFSARAVLDSV